MLLSSVAIPIGRNLKIGVVIELISNSNFFGTQSTLINVILLKLTGSNPVFAFKDGREIIRV